MDASLIGAIGMLGAMLAGVFLGLIAMALGEQDANNAIDAHKKRREDEWRTRRI